MHTHTHPFNDPFSGTSQVTWYQKCKINLDFNLDFTEARDSEWQWHQLSHMQVWTALQTDNHASTLPLKFFTGRVPFLPPNNSVKALKYLPERQTPQHNKQTATYLTASVTTQPG